MEETVSTDWSKMCRACLKTNVSCEYQFYNNVSPEIYLFCTSIEVKKEETFPKTLCKSCYDGLLKYYNFKKVCLKSQSTLLHINNMKLEQNVNSEHIILDNLKADLLAQHKTDPVLNDSEQIKEGIISQWNNDTEPDVGIGLETIKPKRSSNKINSVKKLFVYTCKLCKKKFKHKDSFEAHSSEHEGIIVNKSCIPCNKVFITWSGLRRHNESEHSIIKLKSLRCTFCGKIFKNRQTLKMHKALHGPKQCMNICNVCGKELRSCISLQNHLETHTENRERKYGCEHCGKKFFTKRTLKLHLSRTHESSKRFICHICNFPFTQKYNLANHLLIHEGKKAFECEICDKSFFRQSSLIEHKRSHSGEKPFHCEYCPKSFASKRWLIDHHKIHTGDKPHKCEVCNQCFTQRGTLVRHMKKHNKLVYTCT